ncbi:fimbrial protein [Aeromonas sp. sif2433]|uniref:fimbrial protein n=1 Tax=Aeromonas sp. sif2433 TaxID=2854794 RepID=UPI001C4433F4|nr:fimbrial protein [Aeromonas sp. sif2433]MBV7414941.1 fimbrial protein [Aeromonas sp. sif2433]
MKKSLLAVAVVLSSGISLNAFAIEAPTVVTGGTVYFNGEVVNAACAVSSDSMDQTVYLDQVRTAAFNSTSDAPANQPESFEIKLVDCDSTVQATAAVSFSGTTVGSKTSVLANTAGAGAAQGVGLMLMGPDGAVLELNTGLPSSSVSVMDGTTIIPLTVDYISTSTVVTPGPVSSVANFNVHYE